MGRSEDLFERFVQGGENVIDEMIADRQSEELFLDFKRSADNGGGSKLADSDRQNLAKALSGFGNSEGGVIVWGVECRDIPGRGDVASAKFPLENPKRFLSRLEGAVSGCTVPAHPAVRHHALFATGATHGYVVTHIAKSYLAPHQCVKPVQYYMRAGSDFVPVPHAVLLGLFGRRPQPQVFHMWSMARPTIVHVPEFGRVVTFKVGLLLTSRGPGVARDLYANFSVARPSGDSIVELEVQRIENWSGFKGPEGRISIVAGDSFKLAPEAVIQPVVVSVSLIPPFDSGFGYVITYGHRESPVHQLKSHVSASELYHAYEVFVDSVADEPASLHLIKTVMGIREPDAHLLKV